MVKIGWSSQINVVYYSMMNTKEYQLYKLLFPDGYFYYGYTGQKYKSDRKSQHNKKLRDGEHVKSIQEHYNKIKQYPEFIKLEVGSEYDIRCREHYLVEEFFDNPKCLNTQRVWPPHIIKLAIEEGYHAAHKQAGKEYSSVYNKSYDSNSWSKTPPGKINTSIGNARARIKYFTKLEKWNKVDWWKGELNRRIVTREEYKNSTW
jgi:hypothetical protein